MTVNQAAESVPYEAVRANSAVQNAAGSVIEQVAQVGQLCRTFLGQANTCPLNELGGLVQAIGQASLELMRVHGSAATIEQWIKADLEQQAAAANVVEPDAEFHEENVPVKKARQTRKPAAKRATTKRAYVRKAK